MPVYNTAPHPTVRQKPKLYTRDWLTGELVPAYSNKPYNRLRGGDLFEASMAHSEYCRKRNISERESPYTMFDFIPE